MRLRTPIEIHGAVVVVLKAARALLIIYALVCIVLGVSPAETLMRLL